jgi:hypothetical protein
MEAAREVAGGRQTGGPLSPPSLSHDPPPPTHPSPLKKNPAPLSQVILLSVPDDSSEHWAFPDPGGRFERELAARLAGLGGNNGGVVVAPPPPPPPPAQPPPDASTPAALDMPVPSSGADLLAAGAALAAPPPPPGALPYELRAVEACLAEALSDLSAEAAAVADKTLPALECLAEGAAVTRRGLEAVRGSKLAIKRLEARITGLKRELEEIINDDDDMRDMLLTYRKGLSEGLAAATAAAAAEEEEGEGEEGGEATEGGVAAAGRVPSLPSSLASDGDEGARRSISPPANTLRRRRASGGGGGQGAALAGPLERLASAGWAPVPLEPFLAGGDPAAARPAHHHPVVVRAASHHDVAACESMLESYFMQADFLLSRLFVLKERIDDTEDLVGIELDTRRNELVALQLLVTLATASLAIISTVGSLLGMNLAPLPIEATVRPFYWITFGSLAGGVALFAFTLWYARSRRILWIPKVPRD